MLNYSIIMRGNPTNKEEDKKAYGVTQYNEVMDLNKFASHIATHGCVYSRADIAAILTLAVDCLKEQLLAGQKVQLGDLGNFSLNMSCKGALTAEMFNPAIHVKKVYPIWDRGDVFGNLKDEVEYSLVASRKAQKAVLKGIKAGETTVDLAEGEEEESGEADV